jgi:hypothetical protein
MPPPTTMTTEMPLPPLLKCVGRAPRGRLIAQLGGSDADQLCAVALRLQPHVDAIDLNLGCPQRCAEQGGYGAFLLDEPERVRRLVETLVARLAVPLTAKIRIHASLERTVAFALMLQEAGVAALCVHGRRREQRHHEGAADWDAIATVKVPHRATTAPRRVTTRRAALIRAVGDGGSHMRLVRLVAWLTRNACGGPERRRRCASPSSPTATCAAPPTPTRA